MQDYPIEQYIRDAKIDSLYEGTTAIQALDFFFRKIVRDQGESLPHVTGPDQSFIEHRRRRPGAQSGSRATADRVRGRQAITAALTGYLMSAAKQPTEIYKVGLGSVRYLLAVGDLLIGWRLLVQAAVAHAALAGDAVQKPTKGSFIGARSRSRHSSRRTCCRS